MVLKIRCSGDWTGRLQALLDGKAGHAARICRRHGWPVRLKQF